MELLGLLFVLGLLAIPVLAIAAFVRSGRLQRELPGNLVGRLRALEQQVGELTRRLGAQTTAEHGEPVAPAPAAKTPAATPVKPGAPPVIKPVTPPAPPPPPVTKDSPAQPGGGLSGLDLETLIAGRWLNRIGIVAVLVGVAYFLKLAFDNNWVGPGGRVAIGLVAGSALLYYSQWLLNRGWQYFSSSITGLGAGVLYLSLYASFHFYHLVPQAVAFAGMIAVTAALVTIALGRDAQTVAVIALVGGYLTPQLMSTGVNAQVELFTYLAILNGGMLFVARLRSWRSLEWLSFLSTLVYFTGWYGKFYEPEALLQTIFFATLFFAEFAALPVLQARREGQLRDDQIGMMLINAVWFPGALYAMLYDEHRWAMTFAILALSAAHLAVLQLLPKAKEGEEPSTTRILFAGLALTFATLAIPVRLEGKWLTMAWAVEGAMLTWSSFRVLVGPLLRKFALLLFGLVFFLLFDAPSGHTFLLNPRFVTFAVAAASFAFAFFLTRKNADALTENEQTLFKVVGVAANLTLLWGLSMEVWDAAGRREMFFDMGPHRLQQTGLALFWILYATTLVVVGLRRKSAALRWQGLILYVPGLLLLWSASIPAQRFLWNPRFLSWFVALACLAAVFYLSRQLREALSDGEELPFNITGLLANLMLWWSLSHEIWDTAGRLSPEGGIDPALAQQLGLTLLWIVYATVLVVWGVRRGVPALRWQGLILFGIVVLKVFILDSSYLDRAYRVLSFLALGVLLLVVSFLYQKRLRADRAEKEAKE